MKRMTILIGFSLINFGSMVSAGDFDKLDFVLTLENKLSSERENKQSPEGILEIFRQIDTENILELNALNSLKLWYLILIKKDQLEIFLNPIKDMYSFVNKIIDDSEINLEMVDNIIKHFQRKYIDLNEEVKIFRQKLEDAQPNFVEIASKLTGTKFNVSSVFIELLYQMAYNHNEDSELSVEEKVNEFSNLVLSKKPTNYDDSVQFLEFLEYFTSIDSIINEAVKEVRHAEIDLDARIEVADKYYQYAHNLVQMGFQHIIDENGSFKDNYLNYLELTKQAVDAQYDYQRELKKLQGNQF